MRRIAAVLGVLILLGMAALAQDPTADSPGGTDENGFLVNLLQERISGPGRRIELRGISGALSSQARIAELTVSDDDGVWLRLEGVEIDWSRAALLLGRLNVNRLGVDRVAYLRRAIPPDRGLADRLPEIDAQPFRLPELPVSVQIRALDLPRIDIAEAAFGQAASLGVTGRIDLARGALDAAVAARRLDEPGGLLDLGLDFSNQTRALDLDLRLQEPAGGVVTTLLGVEGRPAIDLRLQGAGPLDALDVTFSLDAGGARIAGGDVTLRAAPDGLGFAADFRGGLAPVVPAPYRDFFAGETSVALAGVSLSAGGVRVDRLALRGAALDLTGALETAADGFPRNLTLSGRLGDARGPALTLPVPGGDTRLHAAALHLDYGASRRWTGLVALDRFATGGVEVEDLTLSLGGSAENLDDPGRRKVTLALEGVATGVWAADADLAAVLGTRLDLFADAAYSAGGPLVIRQAQVGGNGLSLFAAGTLRGLEFDGRLAARLADISPASGLAGRDLGGSVDVRVAGSLSPLSGGFDLALDGSAQDLRLGIAALDGLLEGVTTLSGDVARDADGFRTEAFRLGNAQIELTSSGRLSRGVTDLAIDARLADLSRVDPRLAGALTASGRATGSGRPLAVRFEAEVPEGRLLERPLTGLRLGFEGESDGANLLRGALRGDARFEDQPVVLSADIDLTRTAQRLSGLVAEVGPNRLSGEITRMGAGPILGSVTLAAPDVAPIAALALAEASGSVDATIDFLPAEIGQGVSVDARARALAFEGATVGALDVDALVVDALGAPLIHGDVSARELRAAGFDVASFAARADQTDATTMQVSAQARLAIGTEAEAAGALTRLPDGFAATLDTLALRQAEVAARLAAPATITVAGGAVRLTPLALDLGAGRLTAEGAIAETIELSVALAGVPLSIANAVQPDLGLEGVVTGSARVTGPRAAPDATFDLSGEGLASAATRAAGVPPARFTGTGRTTNGRLNLDAQLAAAGFDARATGSVPLGPGALAVDVELAAFPLPMIERLAGDRGLAGTIAGTAQLRGTVAAPAVAFDLRGSGVSARVLGDSGVAPLNVTAAGDFTRNVLTLRAAEASNAQGVAIRASGRAPLSGAGLDLRASGEAPLSIANTLLAARTAQASGPVRFDLTARGSLRAPRLGGGATIEGGSIFDPATNIRLQNVSADAVLEGQNVLIRRFRARAAAGGEITASGSVSLDGARGNPADLSVRFDGVRYTDGSFVSTQIDGELAVRGPIVGGGGVLSGRIDLGKTEISVVEGLGRNAQATLEEVIHRLPPPRVVETLRRAQVGEPRTPQPTGRSGLQTNVRIRAPNQIFVRGRGLDVELGGELTITGPTTNIVPVGQFVLRRGRLEVLGQRIDFDEGSLRLTGNLDPQIDFVARTRSDDVTAIVTVSGRVSSPEFAFTSQPPLPQDEVLARVIFNRGVERLSPFQIAQLAAAAAELAGAGGGTGILSQLRGAIGFDDLDIVTEEDGETAVRAGRYIDENIYVDVQAGTSGETSARVNLDINENFTVRGSVSTDGNSTLGVFFERDY